MIELSNGNIALSAHRIPNPIVIIDSSSYQIITLIQLERTIFECSILCVCDEHSFVYACYDTFLQISNVDGSILFQYKKERFCRDRAMISL